MRRLWILLFLPFIMGANLTLSTQVKSTDVKLRSSYTDYCADANCVGCWRFNEDTITPKEIDISGNDEHLTETSGTIPYISGKEGNARDFEAGDTEYLTHADGGSTDISGVDQEISICAWINLETKDTTQHIVSKYIWSPSDKQYDLYIDSNNNINFKLSNDGTANYLAIGGTALSTSTWYHICGIYNDIDIRVYVDGNLDSNGADNPKTYSYGIHDSDFKFTIGAYGGDGTNLGYMDGIIDEVAIFNRALTSTEVSDIYNNGLK